MADTADAVDAIELANWKRAPFYVFGFEVYFPNPRSDVVEIAVLTEQGFDRYDSQTNRWTYDDRAISHCSMVAM